MTGQATAVSNVSTAKIFYELTASDVTEYEAELKALYCLAPGDAVCEDWEGNIVIFPVVAGQILYIRPKKLRAATTATMVGFFT